MVIPYMIQANGLDFLPSDFGRAWKFGEEIFAKGQHMWVILGENSLLDCRMFRTRRSRYSLAFAITFVLTAVRSSFPLSSHDAEGVVDHPEGPEEVMDAYSKPNEPNPKISRMPL